MSEINLIKVVLITIGDFLTPQLIGSFSFLIATLKTKLGKAYFGHNIFWASLNSARKPKILKDQIVYLNASAAPLWI